MKKVFLGFGLMALAGLLLFKDSIQFPNVNLPLWLLIVSAVFIIGALTNLAKKDVVGSVGSLVILFIIFNAYYDLLSIGTGTLVAALVLASLGIQFLLKTEENNQ